MRKLIHSFELHSNESGCRKSGRLGLEQVIINLYENTIGGNKSLYKLFYKLCRRILLNPACTADGSCVCWEETWINFSQGWWFSSHNLFSELTLNLSTFSQLRLGVFKIDVSSFFLFPVLFIGKHLCLSIYLPVCLTAYICVTYILYRGTKQGNLKQAK